MWVGNRNTSVITNWRFSSRTAQNYYMAAEMDRAAAFGLVPSIKYTSFWW